LYKEEFDLLNSNNFIYVGEVGDVYCSYYGELYPIGKSASSFQTITSFTNYTVYNVTNNYIASASETETDIANKLKTYIQSPTKGTNTDKIRKTITISGVSSTAAEFTYNISQNYIVCDISKYASYNGSFTQYALGAIPVSVSIELNTEIDLTDKIECFYLGDVVNNNYINIKPLSAKVGKPSEEFVRPTVSKQDKVYTFTFNTTKRIRYIVFRLTASSDDIIISPTDCFTYNGETKQYDINPNLDSKYIIETTNDQGEVVSTSLNISAIKNAQNIENPPSYSITKISISFYPMGYNYNKLDKFNLYKYGPFIREYNSNADRIVSGINQIQKTSNNKNELSAIKISASASASATSKECAKISSDINPENVYIKQFSSGVKLVYADNYIFPPDLFYYCSNNCNIDYALESLYKETSSNYYNRNFGRIPPMLFESLTSTTSFTGIFKNNRLAITPYFIPYSEVSDSEDNLNAGLMYPTTLFAKNTAITTLSEAFANTVVAYNCVLSGSGEYSGLLTKNANLSNVSKTFANIHYFGRDIVNLGEWEQIFSNNKKLSNLSGCFAQNGGGQMTLPGAISSTVNNIYGFNLLYNSTTYNPIFPEYIDYVFGDNGKLHSNSVISDITYMFYNQTSLSDGYLPEFNTLKLSSAKYKSCFGNCDFSSSSKFEKDYSKTVYATDSNWTMSTT
jgi:hypothetical protein